MNCDLFDLRHRLVLGLLAILHHGDPKPGMHIMTKPFAVADLARRARAIVAGE